MTPHLRFGVDPGTPPDGATVEVDGDEWVVQHPDYDTLTAWRLERMRAGAITHADLRGGGQGDVPWSRVSVHRRDLAALFDELDSIGTGAPGLSVAALRARVAGVASLRAAVTAHLEGLDDIDAAAAAATPGPRGNVQAGTADVRGLLPADPS